MISVSVGITFAAAGSLAEDALRDADVAMYRAKQSGKNRVATFDDSLRAGIFERATAERALHAALDQGGPDHPQLTVSYQPVIDLDSGQLAGFEALPRLTDSAGEPILHEVFTYVAEHTALIGPLGETVLDIALNALVDWRAEHPERGTTTMGVNFSARQAQQADMPALVWAALDRHGLRPSDLVLELTELVLIEAGSSTLRQLTELRASGVGDRHQRLRHWTFNPEPARNPARRRNQDRSDARGRTAGRQHQRKDRPRGCRTRRGPWAGVHLRRNRQK